MAYDHVFKVILLGDSGVGKTSLETQFTDHRFGERPPTTLGAAFATSIITLRDDVRVKLQIWDTAGQERFNAIAPMYYRCAAGALIVFDVTKRRSFENVMTWLQQLQEHGILSTSVVIVGNKCDLPEEKREVTFEEAADFAKAHDLPYIETSAKTAQNVDDAFRRTADGVLSKIESGELDAAAVGLPGARPRSTRPHSDEKKAHSHVCFC